MRCRRPLLELLQVLQSMAATFQGALPYTALVWVSSCSYSTLQHINPAFKCILKSTWILGL